LALLLAATLTLLALLTLLTLLTLLRAFLALLASSASEPPYEALGLVGCSSDGVLRPLHGLPGLVGHLACSILRSSALLLIPSASLLGLGGAGLLDGLLGLCGRRDLQVEEAPVRAELQADERSGLVGHGARGLSLFVGGPLGALGPRQIGDVAYYLLVYRVALLVDGFLDDVALFVDGALDGLALLVGGGFAEQLGTGGEVLGYLADLINRTPGGVLDLPGSLARGVLDPLHGLPGLLGDATERALTLLVLSLLVLLPLLFLIAFAH
jgi:hypothetical protein